MAAPTLTSFAQGIYDELAPLAYDDEKQGWSLAYYCAAIAKMFDQVNGYASTQDDGAEGWGWILDPNRAPAEVLPWLGQFYGVQVPEGTPEGDARAMVSAARELKRGTPQAIKDEIAATLTGGKRVLLFERDGGNAYRIRVSTFTSETPDAAASEAALLRQKPAGIMYTFNQVTGGDFNSLRDTHASFAALTTTYADFNEVLSNPTK